MNTKMIVRFYQVRLKELFFLIFDENVYSNIIGRVKNLTN